MRITIETERRETVSVTQDGQTQSLEAPEAIDGGGPPEELVALLSGELAEETPEGGPSEPREPEDAGAAPEWLVDVIEGPSSIGSSGLAED